MNKQRFVVLVIVSILAMSLAMPAHATFVQLSVPFMKQLWNDDTCGHGSCGPASVTMCSRYVLGLNGIGGTPTVQDMINIWSYLGLPTDGNYSNGTTRTQLVNACHDYFALPPVYGSTMTLSQVKTEIAAGRPVVLHVLAGDLPNRGYTFAGGHWIAAVGYTDQSLICHDPGTYQGSYKYYGNANITNAMADRGNEVVRGFNTPAPTPSRPNPGTGIVIQYTAHCAGIGWQSWVMNGAQAGTTGQSREMQAIAINSDNTNLTYSSYVGGYWWQANKTDGQISGTTGISKRMEAVKISCGAGYKVYYKAYVGGIGWQDSVMNGAQAGVIGSRLEALKIWLVCTTILPDPAPDPGEGTHIQYTAQSSGIGWHDWALDGSTTGTVGHAMEGVCISSPNTTVSCRAECSGIGWQEWVTNGALSGSVGISCDMEAIQITVGTGYSVSYRAYVEGVGWQGWVSDGATAGTTGQSKHMEALEVVITAI